MTWMASLTPQDFPQLLLRPNREDPRTVSTSAPTLRVVPKRSSRLERLQDASQRQARQARHFFQRPAASLHLQQMPLRPTKCQLGLPVLLAVKATAPNSVQASSPGWTWSPRSGSSTRTSASPRAPLATSGKNTKRRQEGSQH